MAPADRRTDRGDGGRVSPAGKRPGGGGGRRARPSGAADPVVDLDRERRVAGKVAELRTLVDAEAVDGGRTRAMLAGELDARPVPSDPDVSTSLRLPGSLLARADVLAGLLPGSPGSRLTRSGVIRAALDRGLAALEAEAPGSRSPAPDLAGLAAELDALRARVGIALGDDPGRR